MSTLTRATRTVAGAVDTVLSTPQRIEQHVDPAGFGRSLSKAFLLAARQPTAVAGAGGRFAGELASVVGDSVGQALGRREGSLPACVSTDKRFRDDAWTANAFFTAVVGAHTAVTNLLQEIVDAGSSETSEAVKAKFGARLVSDAIAPSNFLLTNPVALRRTIETRGRSAVKGFGNLISDLRSNGGWPSQVDTEPFVLGENMAVTEGQVVFRNELIELIQYAPRTSQVRERPLLFCPPWINKYYIMDLAPGKSLIEHAVNEGFRCFAISYRNPDSSMGDLTLGDYLRLGPVAAIDVVREITGCDDVNTLGVCLGGTLNTCLLAYFDAIGDTSVHSSTYLNCLNDFTDAGVLGQVYADGSTVDRLKGQMRGRGYLEGKQMARTFDVLRANDLVFNYVASSWLMGEDPAAFDLLAWNNDSTNMPAAVHSEYLQACYVDNALANDELELLGERLIVSQIAQPTYVVAAVDDHIVPWKASFRTSQMFAGESRFVLSSAGHIAGIVNPPGPKPKLWTNDEHCDDPDTWRDGATCHAASWWTDWASWMHGQSGAWVDVASLPASGREPLCAAPGTYVFG